MLNKTKVCACVCVCVCVCAHVCAGQVQLLGAGRWGDGRGEGGREFEDRRIISSLLQDALLEAVRSCSTNMPIHTFTLSDQVMRCHPHLHPPSTMPCMIVLHKTSCHVIWSNHASFQLFTQDRRGSCHPTRLLTSFRTYSLVSCSQKIQRNFFLSSNTCILLSVSARSVQVSHP